MMNMLDEKTAAEHAFVQVTQDGTRSSEWRRTKADLYIMAYLRHDPGNPVLTTANCGRDGRILRCLRYAVDVETTLQCGTLAVR